MLQSQRPHLVFSVRAARFPQIQGLLIVLAVPQAPIVPPQALAFVPVALRGPTRQLQAPQVVQVASRVLMRRQQDLQLARHAQEARIAPLQV